MELNNYINNIDYHNQYYQHENDLCNLIPPELFSHIFSYLEGKDLQSTERICKSWKEITVETTKRKQFNVIKELAEFLSKNLDPVEDAEPIARLLSIGGSQKILDSISLLEVKLSALKLKENLLNILKDLNENKLDNLEKIAKDNIKFPNFLISIFNDSKIEAALTISCNYKKSKVLSKIIKSLLENENIDKAIEITHKIPHYYLQAESLFIIVKKLLENGTIDKAIKTALIIHDSYKKSKSLFIIIKALLKNENIDKAIEIAREISNNYFQLKSPLIIIKKLLKNEYVGKAIEIALAMPVGNYKSEALASIIKALIKNGTIDKAIEIAFAMPVGNYKSEALTSITKALIKNGSSGKAMEVFFHDENYSWEALTSIVKALIKNGSLDNAMKVLIAMSRGDDRSEVLARVFLAMPHEDNRSKVLAIAKVLLEDGNLDKAFEELML